MFEVVKNNEVYEKACTRSCYHLFYYIQGLT